MSHFVTVQELLDGHSVLDIQCPDRIYLSGFVNSLQTPGGVVYFLHDHRGMPIASPAVFGQIGDRLSPQRSPRPGVRVPGLGHDVGWKTADRGLAGKVRWLAARGGEDGECGGHGEPQGPG